jgi:hypothetical protein
MEHIQFFCSKIASKAEAFMKSYELFIIVDLANWLQPTERRVTAMEHCKQMLTNSKW